MTARGQLATAIGVLLVLAIAGYAIERSLHDELFPVVVGTRAPDFHAATLDSAPREKSLDDYRGQVVLLNVWATWCLPCRVEMPSIEKLHRKYGPQGLKVVAVSIDDPRTEHQIRDFARAFGLTFEILHDAKNTISTQYGIDGYPETFVVGRDGIIRKKLMQASDWNSTENQALIQRLLAERVN